MPRLGISYADEAKHVPVACSLLDARRPLYMPHTSLGFIAMNESLPHVLNALTGPAQESHTS